MKQEGYGDGGIARIVRNRSFSNVYSAKCARAVMGKVQDLRHLIAPRADFTKAGIFGFFIGLRLVDRVQSMTSLSGSYST